LLIGFPIGLILAWAFEMTPEGMKLTANVPEGESIAPKTGRKLDYAILGGLALVAVVVVMDRMFPKSAQIPGAHSASASEGAAGDQGAVAPQAAPDSSIAVLPFADMSAAKDQEYFSDGIAEEILNVLAQIPGLKVAGRTSSFSFKGKNEDLKVIGAALGVANILEGSIRKQGDRVRITAQLVKAEDGFHLWSQTYDRDVTDIFAVQDEISGAIANALAVKMNAAPASGPQQQIDSQAYDLYLRARQLLAKRDSVLMAQSVALFDAVNVLAPEFDAGWSASARAHQLFRTYNGGVDVAYHVAKSEAAAKQALLLNPENAEAHSAIGVNDALTGFDLVAAIAETRTALAAAPNDAEIVNFAGDIFRDAADFDEGLKWENRAAELDPLQAINEVDLAYLYVALRRCDEAVAHAQKSLVISPLLAQGAISLATAELCAGDLESAKESLSRAPADAADDPFLIDVKIRIAAMEGRKQDARKMMSVLKDRAEKGDELFYVIAQQEVLLGDYAAAALSLRRAYDARDSNFLSDLWTIVPEDWPDDPAIQTALDQPALRPVWEVRRKNLASFPRAEAKR
jgi:TolB-like protein/Tfp pilus assembly protein PilF